MSNPYDSPIPPPGKQKHSAQDAATVVFGQKLLIFSIVIYLFAVPPIVGSNAFLEGTPENPVLTPMFGILLGIGLLFALAAAICACVGIFRMGAVLFPGSTRYLYAIGVLIPAPLIGLIVMLVANSNATGYLKAHGYKIGFLGAKKKKFAEK